MLKRLLGLIVLVGLLIGCDKKKEVALQMQVDSLRSELTVSKKMTETLTEIGGLLDSIDQNRRLLRTDMAEGVSYNNYVDRMRDLNEFVSNTQKKIDDLEMTIKKSKGSNAKYLATIAQLKKDLEERTAELATLTEQVAMYKAQNDTLITTVNLQNAEINDKAELLLTKQQELQSLEEQVKKITDQSKYDMADAYYQRALALEEAAKRTKFAPKKKKNTQKEALELYKLAASGGKQEAADKVAMLEKEI